MKLFYLTTNEMWGGSEELWSRSLIRFSKEGHEVIFSAKYQYHELDKISGRRIEYFDAQPSLFNRVLNRLGIKKFTAFNERLKTQLTEERPSLVIISRGVSVGDEDILDACRETSTPYLTVTQIVGEVFYIRIESEKLFRLREGYISALRNFFVSHHNLALNKVMIGLDFKNGEVVFNPCKVKGSNLPDYLVVDGQYQIGMVGRLECFHKGYDLMVEVMSQKKWRERPIQINIYGKGPHLEILKSNILMRNITSINFKDQVSNVSAIWSENQILLMTSRIEGQSLSLIEAMWCQRAAIVTNAGGAKELITEGVNGFVAEDISIESIDAAMERAWINRDGWEAMGKKAHQTIVEKHPEDEVLYFNKRIEALMNFESK